MLWALRVLLSRFAARVQGRSLLHALALPARGGVPNDGLTLKRVRSRMEIEWKARDIHPWDRDAPREAQAQNFLDQFLTDTEAEVDRMFEALPQIDTFDIIVRDPVSDRVIASGTLDRISSELGAFASARMRLMARGFKLYLNEAYFERLQPAGGAAEGG